MGEPARGKRWRQRREAFIARWGEPPEVFVASVFHRGLGVTHSANDVRVALDLSYPVGHPEHPYNPHGVWVTRETPLEEMTIRLQVGMCGQGFLAAAFDCAEPSAPACLHVATAPTRAAAVASLLSQLSGRAICATEAPVLGALRPATAPPSPPEDRCDSKN